jgi:UDP-glucose 4-epimerase
LTAGSYDLSGRRVLITGGAGFVGSATVSRLIAAGCNDILVVDDMTRGRPENLNFPRGSAQVRLVVGDIRDQRLMRDIVPGVDTVFHLAALRITQCADEPRRAIEVMIDATYDLLELCAKARIRKVVMASSASVYGMAATFPTPEDHHPYANRTLYGAAKAFGEALLRSFNEMYGLDYVALRYFNAYGPRMDIYGKYTEVLVKWMEWIEAELPPIIFGDGSQTMDMVYVDDIARANVLAATSTASDTVLNIGSGTEISLRQLAETLAAAMGRPDLKPVYNEERRVEAVRRRVADTSAAAHVLGFVPEVSLDEGLTRLVSWWRRLRGGGKAMAEPAA